ncbi:MAG: hypothetical protein MUC82_16805 [Cypionkella sp.]|jgi:hypothetical protein|nr:hypothetical protein [Cypionkella sp.]
MADLQRIENGQLSSLSAGNHDDLPVALVLACIHASFIVFAIWPEINLRVSHALFDRSKGFVINGNPHTEALCMAVWNVAILLCLVAATGTVLGLVGR